MAEGKRHDKIVEIQAKRLSEELKIEPGSFFTIEEFKQITTAPSNTQITFRGKPVTITMSAKATASILLTKIQRGH